MRTWPRWALYALAVLCNLLWAGAYVTGKIAIGTPETPGFGPYKAAFFRFATAGVLLGAWALWRNPAGLRVRRQDLGAFLRVGLLGVTLTYVFNYTGLQLSTSTAAALIMATEPVWLAILAVIFLHERLTRTRGTGVVLGLTGALLVILSTQKPTAGSPAGSNLAMLGNLLFVASLLWESGAVLTVKKLTERYPGWVMVTYEFVIGSLLLAPFALWETIHNGPIAPTPTSWWALIYLLLPCSLLAYVLWFTLLEMRDASELSVFIFLQPVIGTLLGVLLFRDPFTVWTALGGLLVLGGVAAITRSGARDVPSDLPREIAQAAGE